MFKRLTEVDFSFSHLRDYAISSVTSSLPVHRCTQGLKPCSSRIPAPQRELGWVLPVMVEQNLSWGHLESGESIQLP